MVIAVGDLRELERRGNVPEDKRKKAAEITNAAGDRVRAGEAQANPWDERFRPFKKGPLADIREDIRIYGHGQVLENEEVVSELGGYTPEALARKLIEMGLPRTYKGEIYLTGCETAKGANLSFLRAFYDVIRTHCANVLVRGNLGEAVTFEDGTQGVWAGRLPKAEYDNVCAARNAALDKAIAELRAERAAAPTEGNRTDPDFDERVSAFAARVNALTDEINRLKEEKATYAKWAFSDDPGLTRVLP
jgi:hypothetical protein